MADIDLELLTQGKVRMVAGHPRGLAARDFFALGEKDKDGEVHFLIGPADIDTIAPSFVQGFFGRSADVIGFDSFEQHYNLSKLPLHLAEDIRIGLARLKLDRSVGLHPEAA